MAAQGVRLTEYFASDTPCVPSRAALFSGRPGIENGVVTHENIPAGSALRYGNRERFGGHHSSRTPSRGPGCTR